MAMFETTAVMAMFETTAVAVMHRI
jgi:hypothetical protein